MNFLSILSVVMGALLATSMVQAQSCNSDADCPGGVQLCVCRNNMCDCNS